MSRSLHDTIAEDIHEKPSEPKWLVRLAEPVERIFCDEGTREHVTVVAALHSVGNTWIWCEKTDRDGTICVMCEVPVSVVALREQFMATFIGVLRRNGIHGTYWKSGELIEYEF